MSQPSQPSSSSGDTVRCSASDCWQAVQKLRSQCPLVQCITNYVSMDIMANTLPAIGASPAMAHGELLASVFISIRISWCKPLTAQQDLFRQVKMDKQYLLWMYILGSFPRKAWKGFRNSLLDQKIVIGENRCTAKVWWRAKERSIDRSWVGFTFREVDKIRVRTSLLCLSQSK